MLKVGLPNIRGSFVTKFTMKKRHYSGSVKYNGEDSYTLGSTLEFFTVRPLISLKHLLP